MPSLLSKISSSSSSSSSSGESSSSSDWKVYLLVGVPVVVVVSAAAAAYFYYNKSSNEEDSKPKTTSAKTKKVEMVAKIKPTTRSSSSSSSSTKEQHIIFKNSGNDFFRNKRYDEAINCYSQAINVCPKDKVIDLSTLYQNRAAAKEALGMTDDVIDDTTKSLSFNPKYIKSLIRRSRVYETVNNRLEEALADITTVCILESFGNQSSLLITDRLLRRISLEKAKEFMKEKRGKNLPSSQFIKQYFMSFSRHPFVSMSSEMNHEKLQEITQEIKTKYGNDSPHYLLMDATRDLLIGNIDEAEDKLKRVIVIDVVVDQEKLNKKSEEEEEELMKDIQVNALIKLASLQVHHQQDDQQQQESSSSTKESSMKYFGSAVKINEENADIFLHRAQVLIVSSDEILGALKDLETAVKLDPSFVSALAQKLYVTFRIKLRDQGLDEALSVLKDFESASERFEDSSEIYSLWGQALFEATNFDEADKMFKKAIEKDPKDANLLVHRAILFLQGFGDQATALNLLQKAIEIDDKCQFAFEMLGSLLVQTGNLLKGIKAFEKALNNVSTEADAAHLFSLKEAARAQVDAVKRLGMSLVPEGEDYRVLEPEVNL